MSAVRSSGQMRGRIGALLGILLMALSLRAAVVSVPPLLGRIGVDLEFTEFTTGLLAMLAPLTFAIFGLLTPRLIRALGLERTLLLSVALAVFGQVARAFMADVYTFLALSIVTLCGYGIGNVVLPPLVKKYFPDHIGLVTSGYVTLIAVGTWVAPQFSVPMADASNWRYSVGAWALLSTMVLVPWVIQLAANRQHARVANPAAGTAQVVAPERRINPWTNKVAWGLAIYLAGNSAQTYVYFTWLPPYLHTMGVGEATAGNMLALFAILGLPVSLLVPLWVPRLKRPLAAVLIFTCCWIIGHFGIYLSPTQGTALWVVMAGLGQGTFAIALLMMNLRSRTTYGSGVLSGFAQGIGYAGAGIVPLLFGIVQQATGSWAVAFAMMGLCIIVMLTGALMINAPRTIEDVAEGAQREPSLQEID
ncbi:MFS transporter [Glutamicibacter sp. X7]